MENEAIPDLKLLLASPVYRLGLAQSLLYKVFHRSTEANMPTHVGCLLTPSSFSKSSLFWEL